MTDLTLNYKGQTVVLLTEAEIANNTFEGLVNTDFFIERLYDAMRDFGVFEDLHWPETIK